MERGISGEEGLTLMSGAGNHLAGRLDEVRAFSRVLSESEVETLYEASQG